MDKKVKFEPFHFYDYCPACKKDVSFWTVSEFPTKAECTNCNALVLVYPNGVEVVDALHGLKKLAKKHNWILVA